MAHPVSTLHKIRFHINSAEEIRSSSVCCVYQPDLYNKAAQILDGGPLDLRMGAIDKYKCNTCYRLQECPGHPGHIELAVPVLNVHFTDKIRDILDVLCIQCCQIKCSSKELDRAKGLKDIKTICKARVKCPHSNCGQFCPVVSLSGPYFYVIKTVYKSNGKAEKNNKTLLPASRIYEIFSEISEMDLKKLHITYHPKDLLFTALPVLPNTERPTFDKFESGPQRSVDKLTFRLREIILQNNKMAHLLEQEKGLHTNKKKPFNSQALQQQEFLLQDEVTLFFTKSHVAQSHSLKKTVSSSYARGGIDEGKPLQSRLQGKNGQLRGNLMGKRVNFSARTVITGDPNVDLNEVGIPQEIATTLTIRERVWNGNIIEMQNLVRSGPSQIIGAKSVTRYQDGTPQVFDLRFRKFPLELQYGDFVDRHIQNGDLLVFNRQPTLHRMSLMAMKAIIMKGKTFRMSVAATKPFNADFDGDEMNIHASQNVESKAELQGKEI